MTRTDLALFSALIVATIGALVWLPAIVGFGCAVALAGVWTWRLAKPRDQRD